jgi:hypothetical protein
LSPQTSKSEWNGVHGEEILLPTKAIITTNEEVSLCALQEQKVPDERGGAEEDEGSVK